MSILTYLCNSRFHSYLVTDHRRGDQPWFVLTGDSLLVGDVGRPDLHAASEESIEELARTLYRSLNERLMALPDELLVYPAHYAGSVCGRGLSGHPASSIGFERQNNEALAAGSEDEFVQAVLKDIPPAPAQQAEIVTANRTGDTSAAPAGAVVESSLGCGRTSRSSRSWSRSTPWSGRWSDSSARPCP